MASQMSANYERSMVFMFSVCRRELEGLVAFCRNTMRGGRALSDDPIVRSRLAQLDTEIEAGRALSYRVVWTQTTGGLMEAAPLAAAAKVYSSELMQRLTYTGCDIMGLYGQIERSRWAPLRGAYALNYQTTPGINLAAGTSEIMRNLVSSMGCGLPRSW
jgi:alkylation response protein AidB-like acyl-CoA dehydrogenase